MVVDINKISDKTSDLNVEEKDIHEESHREF